MQKFQKCIGLTDVCQRPASSFILPVPTGESTSWSGPALLAGVSFVFRRQPCHSPGKRFGVSLFLTAIAIAFRWPINTTNFLPQAMPV
jgi:hypothetical protein